MAVECDCIDCGGDKLMGCENGMLKNQETVWKAQKSFSNGIEFGLIVLVVFALGLTAMAFST